MHVSLQLLPLLIILQLTLSTNVLNVVNGEVPSDWEYYGKFRFVQHFVQGELYGKDSKSLFIHRFYYDGEGPPGVTFVAIPKDETNYAQGIPLKIAELDNQEQVPRTLNANYTLALPRNLRVSDVDRLVVWCSEYGVSFGRVDLKEARNTRPERPNTDLILVGPFTNVEHLVSGTVYIQDREHLVIRDFNYDGQVRHHEKLCFFTAQLTSNLSPGPFGSVLCGRRGKFEDWTVLGVPL